MSIPLSISSSYSYIFLKGLININLSPKYELFDFIKGLEITRKLLGTVIQHFSVLIKVEWYIVWSKIDNLQLIKIKRQNKSIKNFWGFKIKKTKFDF